MKKISPFLRNLPKIKTVIIYRYPILKSNKGVEKKNRKKPSGSKPRMFVLHIFIHGDSNISV